MNRKKLSSFERLWRQQKRSETQLVQEMAKYQKFDYVVNPPKKPRVAFGSGQPRVVMPLYGPQLPNIMRKTMQEYREFPGPTDYYPEKTLNLLKDYPSKFGFSAFCSKIPRLPPPSVSTFPPIGTYDVDPVKPVKKAVKPFGFHEGPDIIETLTPAPNTYKVGVPFEPYKLSTAFNTCRIYYPAVAVFCSPINTALCSICEETPIGDYWHNFDIDLDICRNCMNLKKSTLINCATKPNQRRAIQRELFGYARVRYCGFYHDHNGVNAAIPLMSKKLLRFKINRENYLHRYID